MRRFGSRVTIIERNARLAHREDQDVSDMLHDMCREEGIEVVTNARITRVEGKSGEWVKLYGVRDESEMNLEGSHILVASGRTPNTPEKQYRIRGPSIPQNTDLTRNGFPR
jgi:pyruvate/2-oxoglutarate dehydrogenase complex dihydrolipoamide dehydrogenase (E3) component